MKRQTKLFIGLGMLSLIISLSPHTSLAASRPVPDTQAWLIANVEALLKDNQLLRAQISEIQQEIATIQAKQAQPTGHYCGAGDVNGATLGLPSGYANFLFAYKVPCSR